MLRQVHKVPPCLEAPRCSLQKAVRQQDDRTRWQELNPRRGPGASLLPGAAGVGGEHLGAEFTRRLPVSPITGANPEALPKGLAFLFFKTNFIHNQW